MRPSDKLRFLIAHRGGVVDSERSENSFKALEEAIRRGYTHVEIDTRITADGHVICFHNADLIEEAGIEGRISEMSCEAITQVVLTRSGENIPTFEQYCCRCAGRIGVMIDLKGCRSEFVDSYAEKIWLSLEAHGLLEEAMILINKTPRDNQDLIADCFKGQLLVSWRRPLRETRVAVRRHPEVSNHHCVFNHGEDFGPGDVAQYQDLGFKVIASINTQHYRRGDPIAHGNQHIRQLTDCGINGFQIDSCYDPVLLSGTRLP